MSIRGLLARTGMTRLRSCEGCRFRAYAERKPDAILGRIWHWHAGWCPFWKAYQKKLAEEQPRQSPPSTPP